MSSGRQRSMSLGHVRSDRCRSKVSFHVASLCVDSTYAGYQVTTDLIVPLRASLRQSGWLYGRIRGRNLSRFWSVHDWRGLPHLAAGQRSSMAFRISSAHRTASAIALTVAGTLFPPSNWASLRAARILAAISSGYNGQGRIAILSPVLVAI